MGLFDSLFGFFGQQGSTVTQNVTSTQPTTPSGSTYVGGNTSYTAQPAAPAAQPIQISPAQTIQGTYNYVTGIIGGGIQYGQQMIQGIQSPSTTNPIQQIQTTVIGAISPQQQQISQPIQNMNQTVIQQPQQGTIFVQQGDVGQIAVQGKLFYDQSGQYEVLEVPYGHSITNIAASGSAGSLQAGGVSLAPLTPVVYTRESGGTVLDPEFANVPLATQVLANPSAFSDVGAEAYGGYVQPLDNRTLESSGAIIGQYPASSGNLSNLVNPYILNAPKQTWVQDLPWNIPVEAYNQAATISFVDMQNRITPISPMGMQTIGMSDRLIGGKVVAGDITTIPNNGAVSGVTLQHYESDFANYNTRLAKYNAALSEYQAEGSKDAAKFAMLQSEVAALNTEKQHLDFEKENIIPSNVALIDQPGIVGQATNLAIMGSNFARTGDIGQLYKDLEFTYAAGSTHVMPSAVGFGKYIDTQQATMPNPVGSVVAGLAYTAETIYTDVRENPIQDIALVALPGAFKYGENLIARGIGGAVTRGGPIVGTGGKLLSDPWVRDIGGTAIKAALVLPWVYESGRSIVQAPMTPEGKGTAVGHVGYQIGMMGVGQVAFAKNMMLAAPENPRYNVGFISGKRGVGPISYTKNEALIMAGTTELRLRGMPQEATMLKQTWIVTKLGRFVEPPVKNTGNPIEDITGVPLEHRSPLTRMMKENPSAMFGSGSAYGQAKPEGQFPENRLWDLELMQSKEFRNVETMSERFAMEQAIQPDITTPPQSGPRINPEYPLAKGADVDVFISPEGAKTSLMNKPGAIVQLKVPEVITPEGKIPASSRFVSGEKALLEIQTSKEAWDSRSIWKDIGSYIKGEPTSSRGTTFDDIQAIYASGAKFEIDPHGIPDMYPLLPGEKPGTRVSSPYTRDFVQPIVWKIFGSPFAATPTVVDINRAGMKFRGKQSYEKLGFTLERQGDAISKNIMTLKESGAETDPYFRGYRHEKDTYRFVSEAQQLFAAERTRLGAEKKSTLTLKQLDKADAAITKMLGLEMEYQPAKGEPAMIGKVGDIMEIGVERLNVGLTVGGKEIGPIRTTIGEPKFLSEYPVPEKVNLRDRVLPPKAPKKGEGKLLFEIPYQSKPTRLRVAEFLAREGETNVPKMESMKVDMRDMVMEDAVLGNIKQPKMTQPTMPTPSTERNIPGDIQFWGTSQKLSEAEIVAKLEYAEKYGIFAISQKGTTQSPQWDVLKTIGRKYGYEVGNPVAEKAYGQGDYAIVRKLSIKEPAFDRIVKITSPSGTPDYLVKGITPVGLPSFGRKEEAQRAVSPEFRSEPAARVVPSMPFERGQGSMPAKPEGIFSTPAKATFLSEITAPLFRGSVPASPPKPTYSPVEKPPYTPSPQPYGTERPSAPPNPPAKPDYGMPPTPPTPTPPSTPTPTPPSPPPPSPPSQPKPPESPVPPPPVPPPGGMLGGGGGGSSYGYRGSRSWTVKNPVGADLMASKRKMNFRPPKGMKIKKF